MGDQGDSRPEDLGVDEALLALLVCPACREPVKPQEGLLRCPGCGRGFPVRNGVPVMLLDQAIPPGPEHPQSGHGRSAQPNEND